MALAGSAAAFAQDVIITGPAWIDSKDNPDELPYFKKKPQVVFPEELLKTPNIGYVVREFTLDEKGKSHGGYHDFTEVAFERAVADQERYWEFSPGRRSGKPVNTTTRIAFIFNPESAAKSGPNATPRLLEVAVVVVPRPKTKDGSSNQVIFADVKVDVAGNVTAVSGAPADLVGAVEIAVKNWRFAPARRAGQPVEAEVRVPFVIAMRQEANGAGSKLVRPRVISQTPPLYPAAMQASGMRGEVLVDFIVDREGRVRNAFAARSLNPSFDDAAIEAVRRWRFEPGRVGERPVNTHLQVPVVFELPGGRGPHEQKGKKPDLSKLPEIYRYDSPPVPIGTVRPVFPYELLREEKTGRAEVGYVIGADGRVTQIIPSPTATPSFTLALTAAIEQFLYQPAVKDGRPSPSLQRFVQEFDRSARNALVDEDDLDLLRRELAKPESIFNLRDLDVPLQPRSRRPPVFPVSAPAEMNSGEALIEFLIDEEGRARLPRSVQATHEAFAYAAMQSIASWRFEPPQRGGRDVIVRVRIPLKFTRETTAAEPAAK